LTGIGLEHTAGPPAIKKAKPSIKGEMLRFASNDKNQGHDNEETHKRIRRQERPRKSPGRQDETSPDIQLPQNRISLRRIECNPLSQKKNPCSDHCAEG
jgi:hypothetical protein